MKRVISLVAKNQGHRVRREQKRIETKAIRSPPEMTEVTHVVSKKINRAHREMIRKEMTSMTNPLRSEMTNRAMRKKNPRRKRTSGKTRMRAQRTHREMIRKEMILVTNPLQNETINRAIRETNPRGKRTSVKTRTMAQRREIKTNVRVTILL